VCHPCLLSCCHTKAYSNEAAEILPVTDTYPLLRTKLRSSKGRIFISDPQNSVHRLEILKLCREKFRRAKAQLELSLAAAIKDNKRCFYKYISNKRRAKENLHPLLDTGGNFMTKDEEKAEVLNTFFVSVFNGKGSCSPDTEPPEQEDRDGN